MAGMSAAAHLASHGSVTLLEAEPTLAYHTTGRSAALFVVNYGALGARPLAAASARFLESPPHGTADGPLLSDRGLLWVADESQLESLHAMAAEPMPPGFEAQLIDGEAALAIVPALRPESIAGGLYEPAARDIDVAALHQVFVRIARRHGAEIRTGSPVTGIEPGNGRWSVNAGGVTVVADVVVNAAGAWGDQIAELAGVSPIGLQPMRRTAFMVPGSLDYSRWPFVVDADHRFYFKPDGVQMLCSLAEETPSDPGDPKPRMEDVALAIDRINQSTTLGIRTVNSQWTGLRTFSPDRDLVIGEDPEAHGFFWLVGQGGIGIATSPGYGSLLASIVTGDPLSDDLIRAGVDPKVTDPARFRS